MPICKKCGTKFPTKIKIDGKTRNLGNRKCCLRCSPFGAHNTKRLENPKNLDKLKSKCAWHNCNNLTYNKFCSKKCNHKYQCHWRLKRQKKDAIQYKGGKCKKCGYNKCVRALVFHHINPKEKEINISKSYSKSWTFLKKELDKCMLLCHNCHNELHHKKLLISDCKTTNSYKVQKCRRNNKQKAVDYKGGKCKTCGYNKCIDALVFHHVDPNKKDFGISANGTTRAWNKVKEELDKCILLCANCHTELHDKIDQKRINAG